MAKKKPAKRKITKDFAEHLRRKVEADPKLKAGVEAAKEEAYHDVCEYAYEQEKRAKKLALALKRIGNLESCPPVSTDRSVIAAMKHIVKYALAADEAAKTLC